MTRQYPSLRHAGIRYSIVIPTYQRRHNVRECLAGVARLEYPREAFEVIVVDDGSHEPPEEEVRAFAHFLNVRLCVVTPNAGPARARNLGAEFAGGEYLVLLDDDCIPEPNLLREYDARLADHPGALVGGALRNGAPESLCAEASQQLVEFLYGYFNADHDHARWFMSANIACSRNEFLRIGGFGADFPLAAAEDRDFCDRWREAGMPLVYAPRAMVSHVRPMSLKSFWGQHRTYGRGAHHLHRARIRRRVGLPTMEPLTFYFKLLCSPLKHGKWRHAPQLMGLLFISQLAYAVGYYPERRRSPLPDNLPEVDSIGPATLRHVVLSQQTVAPKEPNSQ